MMMRIALTWLRHCSLTYSKRKDLERHPESLSFRSLDKSSPSEMIARRLLRSLIFQRGRMPLPATVAPVS